MSARDARKTELAIADGFKRDVAEILKTLDNCNDVPTAIRKLLEGVYLAGVRDGLAHKIDKAMLAELEAQ